MSAFLSFAAGFAMRPIGALVLGGYIDRIGRRKGLIVTLSIMAWGTVLIAFVPSYATIGIAAPLLVVAGRLLQGFSAGVELGGVSVYLAEMAPPGRKGFYVELAIGQPAGRDHRRRTDRLLGQQADAPRGSGKLGLAHSLRDRLPDRPPPLRTAELAPGNGRVRGAHTPPGLSRSRPNAGGRLGGGARRRRHGGDDDGLVLSHHRLYALVRQERPAALRDRQSARYDRRRRLELRAGCRFPARCRIASGADPSSSRRR